MITLLKYFKNNKINVYIFVICVYTIKAIRFIGKEVVKMIELNVNEIVIKRGDIFYAKLNGVGSVQCNIRPVMVLSNNLNNKYAPTLQVCPLTPYISI